MKKINKNVKVDNYFLGGFIQNQFSNIKKNIGSMATNAASAVSDIAGGLIPSSGDAKVDAITGGISSGLETVGSAFGPIGSAIGKAAGMLTKGVGAIIGSKGSVNTDTGELTKGKGIRGRKNKDNLYAQYSRVNQGINDVNQTSLMQEQWMQEHGDNDFALAADGGIIPTTLAYLDDGELGRTPDGQLFEVPEEGKPTDSNLVKVPVGTQILSDKIKVPGTNKTFAEKGKEIMKTGNYKGKDKYAENSKKLNDWNAQIAYDNLLALQESLKLSKDKQSKVGKYDLGTPGVGHVRYNASSRIKSSSDNPIYSTITDTIPVDYYTDKSGRLYRKDYDYRGNSVSGLTDVTDVPNHLLPSYRTVKRHNPKSTVEFSNRLEEVIEKNAADYFNANPQAIDYYYDKIQDARAAGNDNNVYIFGSEYNTPSAPVINKANDVSDGIAQDNTYVVKPLLQEFIPAAGATNKPKDTSNKPEESFQNFNKNMEVFKYDSNLDYVPELNFDFMNKKTGNKSNVNKKSTATKGNTNTKQTVTPKFDPISKTTPSFAQSMPDMGKITDTQKQNWYNASKAINNPDFSKSTSNFDFSGLVGNLAGLAGPISNIASATPEKAKVSTYTPQFASTDYDITPMLREIDLSNAITRYNINQAGGAGTGANLAQAIQGQVARDKAIANAYNYKNNIENERKSRNTGIYNDWARYNAEAFNRGYMEDAQNRAAADQIRRTGIRDLSTALQTMSKDRRLAKRDQATLAAMGPFLQYGMTGEQYQKLMSLLS